MSALKRFGVAGLVVAPLASFAAADTSAITAAGADGLLIAAAVMGVLVSIWAAKLAYRKFFGG